jgi:hypothetical protein
LVAAERERPNDSSDSTVDARGAENETYLASTNFTACSPSAVAIFAK